MKPVSPLLPFHSTPVRSPSLAPSPRNIKTPLSASPEPPKPEQTPQVARIKGILRRTLLRDENGFPIAEDDQGRRYKLAKSFGISPIVKKMVYTPPASIKTESFKQ